MNSTLLSLTLTGLIVLQAFVVTTPAMSPSAAVVNGGHSVVAQDSTRWPVRIQALGME